MPEPLTPAQRAEWRRLADAATEGPWEALSSGRAGGDHWYVCDDGESIASIHASDGEDEDRREPDAAFIAAARTAVPALDDEVARLTVEVAARDAMIANAPHRERCAEQVWIDRADPYLTPNLPRPACTCWKSAVPREALDTMLREARAGALRDAADTWRSMRTSARQVAAWLDDRADREGADRA